MIRNTNIKKVVLEIILVLLVFFTLFVPNKYSKEILAGGLAIYAVISFIILKKVKTFSTDSKRVLIQLIVSAVIYVAIFYLIGIYSGFYKNPVAASFKVQLKYVILITIIIISSEYIRYVLISKSEKLSLFLITMSFILIDVILYAQMYDITNLNDILSLLRSCNICIHGRKFVV